VKDSGVERMNDLDGGMEKDWHGDIQGCHDEDLVLDG
jgi:hypothetical protein